MYVAEIVRKRSGAPVLSRKEIDAIGENLISDFNPAAMQRPQEIDIDFFVQDYLGAEQDFQYLSHCGVYLGMTVFNDTDKVPVYDPVKNRAEYISARANTVIIDQTLLEENQGHRYRFTMGHEASHIFLHTPYFAYDPYQITLMDLMGGGKEPAMIQCRVDTKKMNCEQQAIWTDKEWMEWQANALSSAILMPKAMVFEVVRDMRNRPGFHQKTETQRCYIEADTVSQVFNVSFQAATIRLKELGIIRQEIYMTQQALCFMNDGQFAYE